MTRCPVVKLLSVNWRFYFPFLVSMNLNSKILNRITFKISLILIFIAREYFSKKKVLERKKLIWSSKNGNLLYWMLTCYIKNFRLWAHSEFPCDLSHGYFSYPQAESQFLCNWAINLFSLANLQFNIWTKSNNQLGWS